MLLPIRLAPPVILSIQLLGHLTLQPAPGVRKLARWVALIHLAAVDDMAATQRARVVLYGRLDAAEVEVDLDGAFAGQVEVPVGEGDEDEAADDVAERGGDEGFPDVEARADVGGAVEDGDGDWGGSLLAHDSGMAGSNSDKGGAAGA